MISSRIPVLGSTTMIRPVLLAVVAFAAVGCQVYDFEPVTPLAVAQTTQSKNVVLRQLKPNLMLLVDKSGSMQSPIDPNAAGCPAGCGPSSPCPASCPTRISELKQAMASFLQNSGTVARMGLALFPSDSSCGATGTIDVAIPAPTSVDMGTDPVLTMTAQQINTRIQAIQPTGGTPTGASLAFLGSYSALLDANDAREDFVVVLTDGLPNCNAQNPNNTCGGPNPNCRCTTGPTCGSTLCALGCLDQDGVVAQIVANKGKGVRTIVVGFGADTAGGDAAAVLQSMAQAGGFARSCKMGTDAECGAGDTCNTMTKTCNRAFYQAKNGTELSAALRSISDAIGSGDPCEFQLDAQPSDPRFLAVIVNDQNIPTGPTTWAYAAGKVTFTGQICTDIKNSTSTSPVKIEIRIVEQL